MKLIVLFSSIVAVLLVQVQNSNGQKLVATQVSAKLPHTLYEHASLYDGNDTIFILAGVPETGLESKVYSYSLIDDTIKELAKFPRYVYDGFATFNDKGDILYMGGANVFGNADGNIYKLELNNMDLTIVETNRTFSHRSRGIKPIDESNTMLIPAREPGGPGLMYCLDLSTFQSCENTQVFPLLTDYYQVRPFVYDGYIYITGTGPSGFIEKINLETLESELVNVSLPYLAQHDVVFDGQYAYIIGLQDPEGSVNGIIRFNPQNMEHQFFPVEDFPVNTSSPKSHWGYGSGVWVKKLNRIYFSGGLTYDGVGESRNEIWYIDLAPLATRVIL